VRNLGCCSGGAMESSAIPFRKSVILVFRDIIYKYTLFVTFGYL
jgi:hypothetical protein